MAFPCKSTCADFWRQDSIVPGTVGKDTNCSVLWVSLATAGWSEKQDPKVLLSVARHSAGSHHRGRICAFFYSHKTAITVTFYLGTSAIIP